MNIPGAFILSAVAFIMPLAAQADPAYAKHEDAVQGRIVSIPSKYSLTVRDMHGNINSIELRHGTVINPIGLTLASGMRVTVYGVPDGAALAADEIDTPYRITASYPVPAYSYPYAPGFVDPYGWYGYGGYPYESTTVIVGGGWHGGGRRR